MPIPRDRSACRSPGNPACSTGFYDYLTDPGLPLERLIVPTRMATFALVASGQASDYEAGGGGMGAHLARVRAFLRGVAARGFDLA